MHLFISSFASDFRLLDSTNPSQSAIYYLSAADLQEGEDRGPDVAAALRSAVGMFSRARE